MRRLVESYRRYGCERVHQLLLGIHGRVNFKRVHRLWQQEHLQVPVKQHKRRRLSGSSANSCIRYRARHRNHVWSYDFLADRIENGNQLKLLVVIDEFTRECLVIEVGRSFTAREVMLTLQYLFAIRGAPQHLRSDNGPEFIADEIQGWLKRASVDTLYIQKASPWENAYVESFNGKLRDELLNRELFLSVAEARYVLDEWRLEYNHHRPHSGLKWQTPRRLRRRWLILRSGLRPSLRLSQPNILTRFSHEHWYKKREGVNHRRSPTSERQPRQK